MANQATLSTFKTDRSVVPKHVHAYATRGHPSAIPQPIFPLQHFPFTSPATAGPSLSALTVLISHACNLEVLVLLSQQILLGHDPYHHENHPFLHCLLLLPVCSFGVTPVDVTMCLHKSLPTKQHSTLSTACSR